MKHIVIALTALVAAASAYAQGVVNFSTFAGATVNAPVTYAGTGALADGTFLGQLYAGAPNATLDAVGTPTPFRTGAGQGYITGGGNVTIPGVLPGSPAQIKLVSWASSLGATYAEALAKSMGGVGESGIISVNVGGGTLPPASLAGLPASTISAIIPEPSVAALGLLGAGLLLIRRKK
jgi:hypothetical protein